MRRTLACLAGWTWLRFSKLATLACGVLVVWLCSLAGAASASAAPGTISTVAGNGTAGFSGDAGPATSAELSSPGGVAVDGAGNLLIADTVNNRVRLVAAADCSSSCPYGLPSTTTDDVYTLAGNGTAGFSGDAGPATSAELSSPGGVAVDGAGNLLIADTGNQLVRLVAAADCSSGCPYGLPSTTRGDIYTIVGTGTAGFSGDGQPATGAHLDRPEGVAVDAGGDLLITDTRNQVVRLVAAADCSSGCPYGLPNHGFTSVTKGDIYTIVGTALLAGSSGDGQPAANAMLNSPSGVAVDAAGDLLIGDSANNRVRLVAAADCSSGCPYGLSTTKGDIYTVAGNGTAGLSGDGGAAKSATLSAPRGVAVDAGGDLLIADSSDNVVRLVAAAGCLSSCPYGLPSTTAGDIYRVAGTSTGAFGFNGDGVAATGAQLAHPEGVAVDGAGNLLIADSANNRVRLVLSQLGSLAAADLSINNSAPSNVVSGNTLTYTITATNNGGQDASGVTVTDPLSGNEHLNLVSASTTQGTCATKAGTVKCSVGTLSGRSNATITIVAIATRPGTFSDTATVTATNVTPADTDDSSTATTTVIGN